MSWVEVDLKAIVKNRRVFVATVKTECPCLIAAISVDKRIPDRLDSQARWATSCRSPKFVKWVFNEGYEYVGGKTILIGVMAGV